MGVSTGISIGSELLLLPNAHILLEWNSPAITRSVSFEAHIQVISPSVLIDSSNCPEEDSL